MKFIRGIARDQKMLLPDSIEEYVDENNPVRVIEAYIDSLDMASLGFVRLQPKDTGRPAYDPRDMMKLYIYGYMNKIRSSRRYK